MILTLLARRRQAWQEFMDAIGGERQKRFDAWNTIRRDIERLQSSDYETAPSKKLPSKAVSRAKAQRRA